MIVPSKSAISESITPLKRQDRSMINSARDITKLEELQYLSHLLELSQILNGETQICVERLCREVESMTQKRVQLCLDYQRQKSYGDIITTAASFPLQFRHYVYGTLRVAYDINYPTEPAISLSIARLLAQTCSWMLYTLEQSAFVQGQCRELDYQIHGSLTKREREVLSLMFRGCNQQAIAEILFISPSTVRKHRQHIYSQLGVHCERDALLAAYCSGMFSLIEDNPL